MKSFFVAIYVAFALVGAACGGGSQSVLRIARVTDPATLDPALALLAEDQMLMLLVHQPLLDVRQGTNLFARGAATWSWSTDGRTLSARLRPEVTFANGRRVFSTDYARAAARIANPRFGSWLHSIFSGIRGFADVAEGRANRLVGVRTPDAETLIVEFERPDPAFLLLGAILWIPVPVEEMSELNPTTGGFPAMGSGPYRLVRWRRGCEMAFEPNPHYPTDPTQPRFDRIEVHIGGDEGTHLMMFERGELDIANIVGNGVPLSDQRRLAGDPFWGERIELIAGLNVGFVSLNTELPPLDDVRVRRALNLAVDRPRTMLTRLNRFRPATGPLPPTMPGYDPELRGYGFDPERARALLREADVALPLRLELWLSNDQLSRLVCEGLQADLHAVGVELDLKAVSFAQMLEVAGTRKRAHMSFAVYNPAADPGDVIATMFDGRSLRDHETFNTAFYSQPEVNRFIEEAATATDPTHRFELYRRAQRQIVADAPWIFLGYRNVFALRQPWIRGPILEPSGPYRLDRAWRGE